MGRDRKKIKVVIVGLGGVGGYFGGLLAKKYSQSADIEVIFFTRGDHLRQIQKNGLKVIEGSSEFVARPTSAVDTIAGIGNPDLLLLCTKSYDLEDAVLALTPCIGKKTIIIPLLNGVDAKERINSMLPGIEVAYGCVYIISRLKQAGVVENSGNIQRLYFGSKDAINGIYKKIQVLFKDAGIDAILTNEIEKVIWEKFIFISSIATATSYFNASIGKILSNHLNELKELINEVKAIAMAKKIEISQKIDHAVLEKLKMLPYEVTSSMHSDFKMLNPLTEIESLTGYVVNQGKILDINVPVYRKMYKHLST